MFFLNSVYVFLLKNIYNILTGPKNHRTMVICELIFALDNE